MREFVSGTILAVAVRENKNWARSQVTSKVKANARREAAKQIDVTRGGQTKMFLSLRWLSLSTYYIILFSPFY